MNSLYTLMVVCLLAGLLLRQHKKTRKENSTDPVKNDVHDEPLPVLLV